MANGDRELEAFGRACFRHTVSIHFGQPDAGRSHAFGSGSGVLILLDRPFLLTARHVVDAYAEARADGEVETLQIARGLLEDAPERCVERNPEIDVTAVDLTGIDVSQWE